VTTPTANLPAAILENLRANKKRETLSDSTGASISGGETIVRALVLRALLREHVLAPDERYVGLLIPPTAGGAVANLTLMLDGRVGVNLNYSLTSEVINTCIRTAGIRHVLTSRKVMERFGFQLDAEVVFLDDLRERVTTGMKLKAAALGMAAPVGTLLGKLGLAEPDQDAIVSVLFTSGSTGEPKGVMLSRANIGANIEAIQAIIGLEQTDVIVGVLPFFHAFGLTVTLWTPLATPAAATFHTSPLEPREIGRLTKEKTGTILVSTPSFLRMYERGCEREELQSLEVIVTGAEHLPSSLADDFERKFGVRPLEGYGATELSPVVSANIPRARWIDPARSQQREGTVGRALPNIEVEVRDRETGERLGPGREGLLWVKGPSVMAGYLGRPDLTGKAIVDGWYNTNDIATIDADGFIAITGRVSQFSKIAGEMVPHLGIEDAILRLVPHDETSGPVVAVTGVPHARKGERIVVLHTAIPLTPAQIVHDLGRAGLPPLYIPAPDGFVQVDSLPMLGSGKLDLGRIRQMALAAFDAEGRRLDSMV
jgi:acyl-[acyl-carrier-protein]-phospholipid O-acyltransferase / long-chain-fatty-acid--[acyl-carrier-protein] ligase